MNENIEKYLLQAHWKCGPILALFPHVPSVSCSKKQSVELITKVILRFQWPDKTISDFRIISPNIETHYVKTTNNGKSTNKERVELKKSKWLGSTKWTYSSKAESCSDKWEKRKEDTFDYMCVFMYLNWKKYWLSKIYKEILPSGSVKSENPWM